MSTNEGHVDTRHFGNFGDERLRAVQTRGMALITVDAVVDITRDLRVLEVVRVVASVASRALKDRIVV